jgi:hypothetical protein
LSVTALLFRYRLALELFALAVTVPVVTVTVTLRLSVVPAAFVTVSVYVVVVDGDTDAPTPLDTAISPGVTTPVPLVKTASRVVALPVRMVLGDAANEVMTGRGTTVTVAVSVYCTEVAPLCDVVIRSLYSPATRAP